MYFKIEKDAIVVASSGSNDIYKVIDIGANLIIPWIIDNINGNI